MGPTALGAWGYVLWISLMAVQIGNFGVPSALLKYLSDALGQKQFDLVHALIRGTTVFQTVVSICLTGAGLVWSLFYLPPEQRVFGTLAVLSIFPSGLLGIASSINLAMESQRNNAIPSMVGIVVQALISIGTLVFDWGLVGLASALLLGKVADTAARWWLALRWFPEHLRELGATPTQHSTHIPLHAGLKRELVQYCTHASMLLVLRLVVWNRSEVFFLKQFCSLEQLAFYSVASGFASIPTSIASPFVRATLPSIFAERGRGSEGARRFTGACTRYLAFIVFPTSVGLLVLSGPLIRVLYGAQYHAAAPVLFLAMALGLLPPLAGPTNTFVTAENGQGLLVRWNVVAAILVIGLDWVLIKFWCSNGAAIANGVGQTIATLGAWVIAVRFFRLELPYRFVGRLFAACVIMAGAVLAVSVPTPDLVAVIVGPPVGAVAFIIGLRLMRVLSTDDVERLRILQKALPGKGRPLFLKLLAWMSQTPVNAQS